MLGEFLLWWAFGADPGGVGLPPGTETLLSVAPDSVRREVVWAAHRRGLWAWADEPDPVADRWTPFAKWVAFVRGRSVGRFHPDDWVVRRHLP